MSQAWLQVIGLCLDMIGVLLIAGEWLLAQRQERTAQTIEQGRDTHEQNLERYRQMTPNPDPGMVRHLERVAQMQRQTAGRQLEATRSSFTGVRTRVIKLGLVFVVLGFICQLLGAWPGCCAVLGVVPGGN